MEDAMHQEVKTFNQNVHHNKESKMEKVLIDEFIVPEESKAAFLEGARKAQSFLEPYLVLSRDLSRKRRMERATTIS
jgi:hypothetical protein